MGTNDDSVGCASLLTTEQFESLFKDFVPFYPYPETSQQLTPPQPKTSTMSSTVLTAQAEATKNATERVAKAFNDYRSPNVDKSESVILDFLTQRVFRYTPKSRSKQYSLLKKYLLCEAKLDLGPTPTIKQSFNKLHKRKRDPAFTREQIYEYLDAPTTNDTVWIKLVALIEIFGGLRASETAQLTFEDFSEEPRGLIIDLTRINTDRAQRSESVFVPAIPYTQHDPTCFYRHYLQLAPVRSGCFFLNCQERKFIKPPMTKGKIAQVPNHIATFLQLPNPDTYTSRSLYATYLTIAADAGISVPNLE